MGVFPTTGQAGSKLVVVGLDMAAPIAVSPLVHTLVHTSLGMVMYFQVPFGLSQLPEWMLCWIPGLLLLVVRFRLFKFKDIFFPEFESHFSHQNVLH